MPERLRNGLLLALGLFLFVVALEVLRVELHAVSWHHLTADVRRTPVTHLGLAVLLTTLNYAALTGYDLLAFAYIGKQLPRLRVASVSLLAYAISNNIGLSMLSGASVRYRFYVRWGLTAEDLSRIAVSYSVTFWLGLFVLGGLSLAVSPLPASTAGPAHALLVPIGVLLMLAPVAYVAATFARRRPLRIRRFELPWPSPTIAVSQVLLSVIEWALAGAVLYVLLPFGLVPVLTFLGAFFVAILLGMASHVPGGVGVFEGLMVVLLAPYVPSGQLLPALVVYRTVYYLLPLALALVALVADEVHRRRAVATRIGSALGRLTELLTPRALAAVTFLAGVVMLFSGATPAATSRLDLLDRVLPLGVIEASHLLTSVTGAALLILSQGLARRLDAAYYLTAIAMLTGMATSLLKGFEYEQAALLLGVLIVLWRARPAFDRRAAFFETRFSPAWLMAVTGALAASVWLGFFAFKHVDYSHDLWWQFELNGQASRFLRASVGASAVLLLFGITRLLRFAPHEAPMPDATDLEHAAAAIAAQTSTTPFLVYLGDKSLLFNDDRTAFIMYGVQGRTWVALGDPVGPDDKLSDLIRRFLERCDDFGGVPVFYEVSTEHLHRYADFGLTFLKLGEKATVDLTTFSLEGPPGAKYRQVVKRLQKDGGVFRIVPQDEVGALLPQLRAVSDDWLAAKASAEKGFSLGAFDESYLLRFPVAVVERDGRVIAFANLWPGPQHVELSIDLMRYSREAPANVMEALFVHIMQWGKQDGYQRFALGMAPLSGFERSPVSSLWYRIGGFLYKHGEAAYNFQGLRAYKDKFKPSWKPHYLVYPGGLRLPQIVTDIAALVAGGYRKIFRK